MVPLAPLPPGQSGVYQHGEAAVQPAAVDGAEVPEPRTREHVDARTVILVRAAEE